MRAGCEKNQGHGAAGRRRRAVPERPVPQHGLIDGDQRGLSHSARLQRSEGDLPGAIAALEPGPVGHRTRRHGALAGAESRLVHTVRTQLNGFDYALQLVACQQCGFSLSSRGKHANRLASPDQRDAFGIIVSYAIKVKLFLGALGGELAAELPFVLMHPKVRTPLHLTSMYVFTHGPNT